MLRDRIGKVEKMTFEEIVRQPQQALKKALTNELRHMGYQTITKKGFVYAKGSLPVLLVAHLDTVHRESVKDICYSPDGKIAMSPQGIGGDDRAGVFMILQIVRQQRCHVLFCEDEEVGGIGATKFAESHIQPEINYIVELDRRGADDAVFYNCDNADFIKFVTGFEFQESYGSFSDISIIAPHLGIAAVNISAGYYNEHSKHEYVDMAVVEQNIQRVGKIVSAQSCPFEYIEATRFGRRGMFRDCYDIFDFGKNVQRTIPLMQLPDSTIIRLPDGDLVESNFQYLVDQTGKVYEYLFDVDVAVPVNGCTALTEHGLPMRFNWDDAEYVEVLVVGEEWVYGGL